MKVNGNKVTAAKGTKIAYKVKKSGKKNIVGQFVVGNNNTTVNTPTMVDKSTIYNDDSTIALYTFENGFENEAIEAIDTSKSTAKTSSMYKKFGSKSLHIGVGESAVFSTDWDDLDLFAEDFTLDFWVYVAGVFGSDQKIFSLFKSLNDFENNNSIASITMQAWNLTSPTIDFKVTMGSDWQTSGDVTVNANEWNHFAICYDKAANRFVIFVNGNHAFLMGIGEANQPEVVGAKVFAMSNYDHNFYIDELRISKSVRYASNFDVPNVSYLENVNGTQNTPEEPEQGDSEETIKTQTAKVTFITSGDLAEGIDCPNGYTLTVNPTVGSGSKTVTGDDGNSIKFITTTDPFDVQLQSKDGKDFEVEKIEFKGYTAGASYTLNLSGLDVNNTEKFSESISIAAGNIKKGITTDFSYNPNIGKSNKVTFRFTTVNSFYFANIVITIKGTSTGSEEQQPEEPTTVTLTINPTPADATVEFLTNIGDTFSNQKVVSQGTEVSFRVSKDGYETHEETVVMTEDKTINVELAKIETPTEGDSDTQAGTYTWDGTCTYAGTSEYDVSSAEDANVKMTLSKGTGGTNPTMILDSIRLYKLNTAKIPVFNVGDKITLTAIASPNYTIGEDSVLELVKEYSVTSADVSNGYALITIGTVNCRFSSIVLTTLGKQTEGSEENPEQPEETTKKYDIYSEELWFGTRYYAVESPTTLNATVYGADPQDDSYYVSNIESGTVTKVFEDQYGNILIKASNTDSEYKYITTLGGDYQASPDLEEYVPVDFAPLWLRGSFNSWEISDDYKMSTTDGRYYTFNNLVVPANSQFKIGNEGWVSSIGAYETITLEGECTISVLNSSYSYNLSTSNRSMTIGTLTYDNNAGTLTLSDVQLGEIDNSFVEFYLRGSFNEWVCDEDKKLTTTDGNIYVINNVSLPGGTEFKIGTSDWGAGYGTYEIIQGSGTYYTSETNCIMGHDMTFASITLNRSEYTITFVEAETPDNPEQPQEPTTGNYVYGSESDYFWLTEDNYEEAKYVVDSVITGTWNTTYSNPTYSDKNGAISLLKTGGFSTVYYENGISKLEIFGIRSGSWNLVFEGSNDNSNYTEISTYTNTSGAHDVVITPTTSYKYIKITNNATGSTYIQGFKLASNNAETPDTPDTPEQDDNQQETWNKLSDYELESKKQAIVSNVTQTIDAMQGRTGIEACHYSTEEEYYTEEELDEAGTMTGWISSANDEVWIDSEVVGTHEFKIKTYYIAEGSLLYGGANLTTACNSEIFIPVFLKGTSIDVAYQNVGWASYKIYDTKFEGYKGGATHKINHIATKEDEKRGYYSLTLQKDSFPSDYNIKNQHIMIFGVSCTFNGLYIEDEEQETPEQGGSEGDNTEPRTYTWDSTATFSTDATFEVSSLESDSVKMTVSRGSGSTQPTIVNGSIRLYSKNTIEIPVYSTSDTITVETTGSGYAGYMFSENNSSVLETPYTHTVTAEEVALGKAIITCVKSSRITSIVLTLR